jgi:hypothetical protein
MDTDLNAFLLFMIFKVAYYFSRSIYHYRLSRLSVNSTRPFSLGLAISYFVTAGGDVLWVLLLTGALQALVGDIVGRHVVTAVFILMLCLLPITAEWVWWKKITRQHDDKDISP